ncbi:uncharacterized protein LOC110985853 isoform X4 [Acanthaster planci]|uniref:Uncharacterized protein LOC110985853 isoform X4 n=1 Tax=Acanthaster planci TaxID=133434 RepID=A0A8B7ZB98_ACAPL|nr:uncharacterized protein LOC110985853 isoform X4 [Acanthaster planci]
MSGAEKPPDSPLSNGSTKHHEGFAEMKGPKDKDYEKRWLMLMDNKIVMYSQRVTQRELSTSKPVESLVIDRNCTLTPDNKEKTKLTVKSKAGAYKFKMSTQDERDNWWIRFYAIAKMELPKIHLLPGQTIALQEIIESMDSVLPEAAAAKSPVMKSPRSQTFVKKPSRDGDHPKTNHQDELNKKYRFYPDHLIQGFRDDFPIPPTWYFEVTRAVAEELLLNNQEHGSIVIRNSESHSGYSLSMRQDPPRGNPEAQPIIKHYRFNWNDKRGSYEMVIEEKQPEMRTMYDLLAFFIEKHGGNIRPIQTRDLKTPQHPYELGLSFSMKDPENGEASQHQDTYLQPQRVPSTKKRPDRQSLPSTFNATLPDLPVQGTQAASASNRHTLVTTPENMLRRQQRFSTSAVPSLTAVQQSSEPRPPSLPPPRQRCVSTSEATNQPRPDPNTANLTDVYNTPSGHAFVLPRQQTSPVLPVATAEAKRKQDTRPRTKTSPAMMDTSDYLAPSQQHTPQKPAPGNQPLPSAHKVLPNRPLVFKPPIKTKPECQQSPPTSYIHQHGRPRGQSSPSSFEGLSCPVAEEELNKVFKKFGIDKSK